MNTKLLCLSLLFVCQTFSISAFAQQNIQGLVTDINSVPLEYFNVEILNVADSSAVKGGTFVRGEFTFNNLADGKYLLKLSSLGYSPLYAEIDTKSLKNITFQLNEISLDEVVVTARMPNVINKEDRFIVEV